MHDGTERGNVNVVTGAFSYTGKYIAARLLAAGETVKTLTNHPKHLFEGRVAYFPYNFDNTDELVRALQGADILFNSYWIRFPYGEASFDLAIENSKILLESAKRAGVKRVVHTSITNPSEDSSLPYFKGKAIVERFVKESGLSYAILRPTVIFGQEDILINNIAWYLRKFPVFGIFGDGSYRIQPVYVDDFAKLAVEAAHNDQDMVVDATGPEIFTFEEMVQLIADKIESKSKIIHLPPWLALTTTRIVGRFVDDIVLTEDEIDGLMRNLLYSQEPPTGTTKLSSWLEENKERVGRQYSSELKRHYIDTPEK